MMKRGFEISAWEQSNAGTTAFWWDFSFVLRWAAFTSLLVYHFHALKHFDMGWRSPLSPLFCLCGKRSFLHSWLFALSLFLSSFY